MNQRGELQQIYWGGRLGARIAFPQAQPMPEWASFDSSYTNTPQEYRRLGRGLFVEPALKVSFADGNRDLVLHYESHTRCDERLRRRAERHCARNLRDAALRTWIRRAAFWRGRRPLKIARRSR